MKPVKPGSVSPRYLAYWHKLHLEFLAQLTIPPERVAEIQKVYPPPATSSRINPLELLFPQTMQVYNLLKQKELED